MGIDGAAVIVTGAAGGIGGRYVHAFAANGANVVATDVPAAAAAGTALAEKAGRAVFVPGDITSDDDWDAGGFVTGLTLVVDGGAVFT